MPTAPSGSYEIFYDRRGPDDGSPMLLVPGLGAQLTSWDDGFVDLLVDAGYLVIRMDNRDIGLSSRTATDPPNVMGLMMAAMSGQELDGVPYTLSEMAADAVAVLDHLELERAHVAGMSMGGMIAQTIAIEHPQRTSSLASVMSTTGDPALFGPEPEAIGALMSPMPTERDAAIERTVTITRVLAGPHFDEDRARANAIASHDRSANPLGAAFQFAAILASGDRTERLRRLDLSTIVIHGRADPLITLPAGEATAAAIPGAELVVYDDMGHDLPEPLWPSMIDAITATTARA